jgi:hypothetical protein
MDYFIRGKYCNKFLYWEHERGLHYGRGETRGYQVFRTKKEAEDLIELLKKIFHTAITFEALPSSEIPFIKKQK